MFYIISSYVAYNYAEKSYLCRDFAKRESEGIVCREANMLRPFIINVYKRVFDAEIFNEEITNRLKV